MIEPSQEISDFLKKIKEIELRIANELATDPDGCVSELELRNIYNDLKREVEYFEKLTRGK